MSRHHDPQSLVPVRRTVAAVAALNAAGFVGEAVVALAIGSVALVADSVDFLEDASMNALVLLALGRPLAQRARAGRVMAVILLLPALAAVWQAVTKAFDPVPPAPVALGVTALVAALVNGTCALLLVRVRHRGGALGRATWLSARNDVAVNLAVVALALVTAGTGSGWPDIVVGVAIVALNGSAALEVWRLAGQEGIEARGLRDGGTP